jgi:electron transfer flavoprotein alpha subunit
VSGPSTVDSLAILPVRDGIAPLGGDETAAEAGGAALLIGSDCGSAELPALRQGWLAEVGGFAVDAWSRALAPLVREVPRLILPASADGRDLAPRLAAVLDRPLLAGAIRVDEHGAVLARWDDRLAVTVETGGPFVATLVPGVRGALPFDDAPKLSTVDIRLSGSRDAEVLEVLEPDPATADLAEAPRILSAGAGLAKGELSGPESVALLGEVATALGASLGATRVVTDAGWAPFERQIGTTGAVVGPELYVAFGVSGAAQHTGGLGAPKDIVSINTDASAPMTALAGLGLVTDAQALLRELARRLDAGETKND